MNKKGLIEAISWKVSLPDTEIEKVITSFTELITNELVKENSVSIKGFGTFEVRNRSERQGRNPSTGEIITSNAGKSPAFRASSVLKKNLNKK